ncbi:hypothetical protein A1QO_07895 [Vibrio genomosp. F10 str. ZF-129]|uniref:Tyr recombinase domain-containing protein n=1 Tax=Vibrio genomosp. F10 str. ZF-129 TaxID=1187848 RepID=A0A1E5BF70_9VIBR|nr:site-specific integrase [Vibrio genomosp. F10]OEE34431.1 hypothetical protein A1QO_07895 [Vibrio genomosp. F10 str. ZF-129]
MRYGNVNQQEHSKSSVNALKRTLGRAKSRKYREQKKLTLVELQQKFLETMPRKNITSKTVNDYIVSLRMQDELVNAQYVDEIDFECAQYIVAAIQHYPKNKTKDHDLQGFDGYDAIYRAAELGKDSISTSRALSIVQRLSTFMNYCVRMDHATTNVYRGQMSKRDVVLNPRLPFANEHLSAIFTMKDYRLHTYRHPYHYWIPLLLRYTGARLNELCALYSSNIKIIDGALCIMIDAQNEDQRVKNQNSTRCIPVHSELIRLGFVEFINSLNSERVFPELGLVSGYYSHYASKWFSNRRAKLHLGKGLDTYSFRHRFITEMRENDISFPTIMSLAGHLNSDEHPELKKWYSSPTNQVYSHFLTPLVTSPSIEAICSKHTQHIRPYNER